MREPVQTRRDFLKGLALAGGACAVPSSAWAVLAPSEPREAMFYGTMPDKTVQCTLCPWRCMVPDGGRGLCGVRENRGGRYYTLVYGYPVALHNDPIEKKPFVHVYPGSKTFSLATVGCNMHCKFCQNWEIAKARPEQVRPPYMSPETIVELAVKNGSKTLAYTYTEPVIFYEYMHDCAVAARRAGLGNLVISNGFIEEEPLKKLLPLITAYKVDLKSFSDDYYRDICSGRLDPVLRTLKTIVEAGVWLELVVLLVPTLNDGDAELERMTGWIVKELGPNVPVNFIRFYPQYRLRNLPPTPKDTLQRAHDIAVRQGVNFVYATDVTGTTRCPACGVDLVERVAELTIEDRIKRSKCPACGAAIPGVWE